MKRPDTYKHYFWIVLLGVILMVSQACTGLRKLPEDEMLLKEHRVHINKEEAFKDDRSVERELKRVLRPVPNSTFFKSRPRMWMYQVSGEPTGRGVRHWMRNRLGEEPVLFDDAYIDRNLRLLNNRLFNLGYFDPLVNHTLDSTRRTVAIDYHIHIKKPYRIRTLYPIDSDMPLAQAINEQLEESMIRPGAYYNLEDLRRERRRIDRELKKQGYFFFHPDHFLFRVDSAAGERQLDLYTVFRHDIPPAATKRYRIGNTAIHADYMVGMASGTRRSDTLSLPGGVYFTDALGQFDPSIITRAVFFKKDSLYDVTDHDRTLNHLMSLGTFRFVNIRFSERPGDDPLEGILDVRVLLTPIERRSTSVEVRGVTKSNHFAGPGFNTSLTNHNLFGGAESFIFGLNGAYETLVGRQRTASSRELGLDATLSFPRFLLPAGWKTTPEVLAPKTNIAVGVNFMRRTDAFSLTSMSSQYGYTWNADPATQFRIYPVVFNLFVLGNLDKDMDGILVGGSLLRRGLFEQFVIGGQYTYVYNSRLKEPRQNDWFLMLHLDLSGNLAYLMMKHVIGVTPAEDGGYGVFRQSFAQYARKDIDARYYRRIVEGHRLAARFFIGAGFPYGNSDVMPYVKQYVTGGSTSIRAFHPRSLGPGTYMPPEEEAGAYNIYQTGEFKLEANVEYRFDITSLFKGALFADAGNIWRWREDEEVPGGKFSFDTFYDQIAIGVGTGLRIDASFFILRFDFAFPLVNPGIESPGFFDPVRLLDRSWRRDNLVFNLAIGYPF